MAADDWCLAWTLGCDVDWTAWAAVFTAAAVFVALFQPWWAGKRKRLQATIVFATAAHDHLKLALFKLNSMRENYFGDPTDMRGTVYRGMLMQREEDGRKMLSDFGDELDLDHLVKTLADWPDTDVAISAAVVAAVANLRSVRNGCRLPLLEGADMRWDPFFAALDQDTSRACTKLEIAINLCAPYTSHRNN